MVYSRLSMIRTAIIGMGYRGQQLYRLMASIPYFDIIAVADPNAENCQSLSYATYTDGADDYIRMLEDHHPDLVVVASPWQHHVEHAYAAMECGAHVALEIKGGLYPDEYASLIALEHSGDRRVYPLENTIFKREILAMQNMVDSGILGEIVYMRGGYRHDLRHLLIDDFGHIGHRDKTESIWRSRFYQEDNCDLYPTHGLAPLCRFGGIRHDLDIKRISSHASKAVGMHQRIRDLGGDEDVPVRLGDVIVTQIETCGGILISLIHDTTLPRPRSLDYEVQGTRGIWDGVHRQIYIEGVSPHEVWESDAAYIDRHEHLYWQQWGREAILHDTHHQGMDYIMLRALAGDIVDAGGYPIDLSDLALWTSVTLWSRRSISEQQSVSP